ncbi:hypothetical protein [Streptomyces nitrosporeus]|uniref:hypothetical protein n=1 Tax=Streptomyces nitrosporeus TaxID=28894 RepID=UPI0039A2DDFE
MTTTTNPHPAQPATPAAPAPVPAAVPAAPVPAPAPVPVTPVPVTAPWVVASLVTLLVLTGLVLCAGAGVLVWVRPGALGPLTTALAMGGFLVGMAALAVSVGVAVRRR